MKALLIIDMQMEMQQRVLQGQDCINPEAGERIATLAAQFRTKGWPVLHIRHRDDDPASPLHAKRSGVPASVLRRRPAT